MVDSQLSALNAHRLDGLRFCAEAYALFEAIRNSPTGASDLRMRRGRDKKRLLEEILPICKYVQSKYRHGLYIDVTWLDGSQSFDAQLQQRGGYVEHGLEPAEAYLEVTGAMHPSDYLLREKLDTDGFAFAPEGLRRDNETREIKSEAVGHSGMSHIAEFAAYVLAEIEKKMSIEYPPQTTLIVQCTLNVFDPQEWHTLVDIAGDWLLQKSNRRFREVFLCDHNLRWSDTL